MIVSLAYVTIETIDPEPAEASSAFACTDGSSRGVIYRMVYENDPANRGTGVQMKIYSYNPDTTAYTLIRTYYNLPVANGDTASSADINAFSMDDDGNAYIVVRSNNADTKLYQINYNSNASQDAQSGGLTFKLTIASGNRQVNAAAYGRVSGESVDKIYMSNGFTKSARTIITINGSSFSSSTSGFNSGSNFTSKNAAKDFVWLKNPYTVSGTTYELAGLDFINGKVMLYDVDNNNSTEVNYSSSGGTWEGGSFDSSGAAYSFVDPNGGNDVVYATDNAGSGLYRLQYESGTFTVSRVSTSAGASSKNDGAGCADEEDPHDPDSGGPTVVSLTASQSLGTCSTGGGTKTSTLSLANSSGSTAYVTAEYKIDSGSYSVHGSAQASSSGDLSISNGNTETLTATVPHGSTITWRYKSSDTTGDWDGISYQTLSASSTVDCDPEATVSQSLGSCSAASGSKTSTLSIRNDDSATVYYLVEYSTNGGSDYSTASSNLEVNAGVTNTSLSQAVDHGSSIIWRYKDSNVSGSFGSASYTTLSASSTVDCTVNSISVSQSLGSCSAGSKTSTLTITNNESYTAYLVVEYSLDGGSSYSTHTSGEDADDFSLAAGATDNSTFTKAVAHGQTIIWRVSGSPTTSNTSATQTSTSESSTVSCPIIDTSVGQALGSCTDAGAKVSTFTMQNSGSANSTAYFNVQYKIDSGSYQNASDTNVDVAVGGSATLTATVPHGSTITWQYRTSTTSGSFTGSYTAISASDQVSCPVTVTSVSGSLGSCGSGAATYTFTMNNGGSATTAAYFEVQYRVIDVDGNNGAWQSKLTNQSVGIGSSA